MDRPYIFCHMMTAPEGKIMSSYTETPLRSAAGNLLYNIAFGKASFCHHPGRLSGRVTTDDNFTFYKTPELDCGLALSKLKEASASPKKLTIKVSAMPTNMGETARQKAKESDGADLYR